MAFTSTHAAAVACQVMPGTITSSYAPMPSASRAIWMPTVPLAQQRPYFAVW